MASVAVGLISVLVRLWGLVFGWVYSLYSNPALVRKAYTRVRSTPTRPIREGDTSVTYKPNDLQCPDLIRDFKVKLVILCKSCKHCSGVDLPSGKLISIVVFFDRVNIVANQALTSS